MKPVVFTIAAALSLLSCHDKPSQDLGESGALAKVGQRAITVGDLSARLNEQPAAVASRYATPERKKELLDGLVRFEILAQEAERRGLDKDPEVRTALRKVMVQKLLHDRGEEAVRTASAEAEVKAYYQEHQAEFVRPERVRVSHIFISAPANSPKRSQAEKQAAKLLVELRAKEAGPVKTAFTQSAQTLSEDEATKGLGGDLGFRTREELAGLWGTAFADSAAQLQSFGEVSGPVATEKGFHLIKLMGRQPGLDQPFDSVRSRIESRLTSEKRSKAIDSFVAELREKTPVTVDEAAVAKAELLPAAAVPEERAKKAAVP